MNERINLLRKLPERGTMHCFVVERGTRWQIALRRFSAMLSVGDFQVSIGKYDDSKLPMLLSSPFLAVVFWEIEQDGFSNLIDHVRRMRRRSPRVLQLAGTSGLTDAQQLALLETGITVIVRHPEFLPKLRPAILGHFARSTGRVD